MRLHYKTGGSGQPIIFLHGLFGNLDNLGGLARALASDYQTIQVDLRNHGRSPWSEEMNYPLMAEDVLALIKRLGLTDVIIIGHSMGGKVAMQLTQCAASLLAQVIILDIAPVTYAGDAHRQVFKALHATEAMPAKDKSALQGIMAHYLPAATCQFLLKSYQDQHWLFNITAIEHHYGDICSWQQICAYPQPILFIRGGQSDYVVDDDFGDILSQFPYATIETIADAGHNVHYDKLPQVLKLIEGWLG